MIGSNHTYLSDETYAEFDLISGTVVLGEACGIEELYEGWYRCWMQHDDKITSVHAKTGLGVTNFVMRAKDGAPELVLEGDASAWGAQMELMPFGVTGNMTGSEPVASGSSPDGVAK